MTKFFLKKNDKGQVSRDQFSTSYGSKQGITKVILDNSQVENRLGTLASFHRFFSDTCPTLVVTLVTI
jgi:hypothetical protein